MMSPKSEFLGFDFRVSTMNLFLVFVGILDILLDGAIFVWAVLDWLYKLNTFYKGFIFVALGILQVDFIQLFIPLFNAPLGVKSVKLEKIILVFIGTLDLIYDLVQISIDLAQSIWKTNKIGFYLTMIIGGLVLTANIISLFYLLFDYEKDHEGV